MNAKVIEEQMSNKAIDILKFLFAVCVIAIHTDPLIKWNETYLYSLTRSFIYIAVPIFFISTGYLISKNYNAGESSTKYLIRRLKKSIKLYVTWNVIYLPLTIIGFIRWNYTLKLMLMDFIRGFFFVGQQYNSWILWYLLSTIYTYIFLLLMNKLKFRKITVYITAILVGITATLFTMYSRGILLSEASIPVLKLLKKVFGSGRVFTGVFYIPLGMFLYDIREKCNKWLGVVLCIMFWIINSKTANVGILYEVSRCFFAIGIFTVFISMQFNGLTFQQSKLLRELSTDLYFVHLWIWSIVYTMVFGEKTYGMTVFLLTTIISMATAIVIECVKRNIVWSHK